MARCAGAALLAAIEIYNKPVVEHREQTFAMLAINAWEVLLKARIVQQANGKVQSIYRRRRGSRTYERDPETGEPFSIGLREAMRIVPLPDQVRSNLSGLLLVRNKAVHLGLLGSQASQKVLEFGTASVKNFVVIGMQWFGESVATPHLLPVGFLGDASAVKTRTSSGQREFLKQLHDISASSPNFGDSAFSVTMNIDIRVNPIRSGGGSIGLTNDQSAPRVQFSDDEALELFPASYADVAAACRDRYPGFRQNQKFNATMKCVNEDANCAHERRLDPKNPKSAKKRYYNLESTMTKLDAEYDHPHQIQRV